MYPAGGYGNFLYYLLTEHLESTVKPAQASWGFEHGNSHQYPKHTESFLLGVAENKGTLKNFHYSYKIINDSVIPHINQGKQFVVLADVGNKGDNVKFLRKYFPNAKIVRVFAEHFIEKLVLWTNCMTKSNAQLRNNLYPGSILTRDGIAIWANKTVDLVNDDDAVNCMVNFFRQDFDIYGKMFSSPTAGVINLPISSFFTVDNVYQALEDIAKQLDTKTVNTQQLEQIVPEFVNTQEPLTLLDSTSDTFPLVREALRQYNYFF